MATTTTLNHNGISLEVSEPLGAMGGVDNQLGGLIGTAPNKSPDVDFNEPIKLYTTADLALIDTTEAPQGSLYYHAKYFLEVAKVPVYVVVVEEGADNDATMANIVGGVSPSGRLTGLAAFAACAEAPTNVAVPSFSDVSIANALAALADQTYCEGWTDAPDTTTADAKTYAELLGEVHKRVWCVDVSGERWHHPIAPSVVGMAARCSVKPSKTPNGAGTPLDDIARILGYRVNDKNSEAVDLNKKGVSVTIRDPNGGLMFLGTRTADGSFGNIVGIENQLCRELIKSHRDTMPYNLDFDFFKQRIAQLSNWLSSLEADGDIIGAKCYLHPTRNNLNRYQNGEWVLVIDWGAYRPNEHSIIELNQSDEILQVYIDSAIKTFS